MISRKRLRSLGSSMKGPEDNIMVLQGKSAMITGGSRGIGKSIATAFAREGARVMLAARSREELESVQKELIKDGARAEVCVVDVSNRDDVRKLVAETKSKVGTIDIVVNAAGISGMVDEAGIGVTDTLAQPTRHSAATKTGTSETCRAMDP